jgi:hypothetical protein
VRSSNLLMKTAEYWVQKLLAYLFIVQSMHAHSVQAPPLPVQFRNYHFIVSFALVG